MDTNQKNAAGAPPEENNASSGFRRQMKKLESRQDAPRVKKAKDNAATMNDLDDLDDLMGGSNAQGASGNNNNFDMDDEDDFFGMGSGSKKKDIDKGKSKAPRGWLPDPMENNKESNDPLAFLQRAQAEK